MATPETKIKAYKSNSFLVYNASGASFNNSSIFVFSFEINVEFWDGALLLVVLLAAMWPLHCYAEYIVVIYSALLSLLRLFAIYYKKLRF